MKAENPFRVLERILGDLTFSRGLRRIAPRVVMMSIFFSISFFSSFPFVAIQ